jgi:hypothetical protein
METRRQMLQIATFGRQTTAATFPQCITTTSLPAGATTSCLIFDGDGVLEGHPRLTIGSVFRHLSSNDHSAFPSIPCAHRQCTATSPCSAVLQPFHERPARPSSIFSAPPSFTCPTFAISSELQLAHRTTSHRAAFYRVPPRSGDSFAFALASQPRVLSEQECKFPVE